MSGGPIRRAPTAPSGARGGSRIERVVVALDAASETRNAIAVAARLAARARARLHGVFIEDEDLLRVAQLPFARHVTLGAGAGPLSSGEIERQLRSAAERVRREFAAAARHNRIEWSFETVRLAADAPLVTAMEWDLVVAGPLARPIGRHFRTEWRWWSSVEQISGPLLLAQCEWSASGPILAVIRDQGAGSARLLVLAARLAEAVGSALVVLCPPQFADEQGFAQWVAEQVEPYSVPLRIERAPADPAELDRRIAELRCRVLAVQAGAGVPLDRLRTLFARLACDILVVP